MDRIDKKILNLLQHDGKMNNQDLAKQVALSPSPCLRRVKQLEKEGYIEKYVALLNPQKLGLELTIIVSVGLRTHDAAVMAGFAEKMRLFPEVVQCYLVAGQEQDYILKVIVPNLDVYHSFLLKKLTQIEGVRNIHSAFVLDRIVDETALPVK